MLLNIYKIIRVIYYFINENGRYYYIIFKFYKIINKYTSKNIVGVLIDIFYNYKIVSNIRYFIANYTKLNSIYINIIFYILYLNILVKLYKGYWLYYFSYIINLYT